MISEIEVSPAHSLMQINVAWLIAIAVQLNFIERAIWPRRAFFI
jgi:predicted anti-sigma-YlaC factor YlaD